MAPAVLFHGESHDCVVKQMYKEAMKALGVTTVEALFRHGDFQELKPISKSYLYAMETIHSVVEESALPPYRGNIRIIALISADRMLPVHANALLKTLEEAPLSFQLMLTTTRYNDILKTILSRVQKVFVPGTDFHEEYSSIVDGLFSSLERGFFDTFLKEIEEVEKGLVENIEYTEKKFRHFLETFITLYVKKFDAEHLYNANAKILDTSIQNALSAYQGNIRIKHVLENLFLETQQQIYSK